jgi:hypothetical protein
MTLDSPPAPYRRNASPFMQLCDFRVDVMCGAKWLVRHKMDTLPWDLLKKDERAIVVATTLESGGCRAESQIFGMTSIRTRAGYAFLHSRRLTVSALLWGSVPGARG